MSQASKLLKLYEDEKGSVNDLGTIPDAPVGVVNTTQVGKYCKHCQIKLAPTAKICPECGLPAVVM